METPRYENFHKKQIALFFKTFPNPYEKNFFEKKFSVLEKMIVLKVEATYSDKTLCTSTPNILLGKLNSLRVKKRRIVLTKKLIFDAIFRDEVIARVC